MEIAVAWICIGGLWEMFSLKRRIEKSEVAQMMHVCRSWELHLVERGTV
jgi:hypothetical protein